MKADSLCLLGCRLYESIFPIDDVLFEEAKAFLEPFQDVCGMNFTRQSDATRGDWHNFFVGVVGDVSPEELDTLWPNRASPPPPLLILRNSTLLLCICFCVFVFEERVSQLALHLRLRAQVFMQFTFSHSMNSRP